jgi:hypothetical protein
MALERRPAISSQDDRKRIIFRALLELFIFKSG